MPRSQNCRKIGNSNHKAAGRSIEVLRPCAAAIILSLYLSRSAFERVFIFIVHRSNNVSAWPLHLRLCETKLMMIMWWCVVVVARVHFGLALLLRADKQIRYVL